MTQQQNQQQKVWTSCCPYAKSKLKIPHFTGVISIWTNWPGLQYVNITFDEDDWDFDVEEIREILDG